MEEVKLLLSANRKSNMLHNSGWPSVTLNGHFMHCMLCLQ